MKFLDNDTAKKAPPSDKRLNNLTFVMGIVSCSCLAIYFFLFAVTLSATDLRLFFVFAYIVFPIQILLFVAGAFICLTQLMRNVYYKIFISAVLHLTALTATIVFILVTALNQSTILLPFIYS